MITRKISLSIAALALMGAAPPEPVTSRVPLIGLEGPAQDACPGIGRVNGLEARKGDQLRVRSDASESANVTDELDVSTLVWLCEADEGWQGIVYPERDKQDLGDCRVSSALTEPEEYNGPCKFGWVEAKFVLLVAG